MENHVIIGTVQFINAITAYLYFTSSYSVLISYIISPGNYNFICSLEMALKGSDLNIQIFEYYNYTESFNFAMKMVNQGSDAYIFITTNTIETIKFKQSLTKDPSNMLHQRDTLLLILSSESNLNITDMFQIDTFDLYPNHLVILPSSESNNVFNLWTQKFVGLDNKTPVLIASYNLSQENTIDLNYEFYRDKKSNLEGKILRPSTLGYTPYSICEFVPNGSGNEIQLDTVDNKSIYFDGSEARIVQAFCRIHNCSLRVFCYQDENYGVIYENGTGEGMFLDLYNNRFDILVGGIVYSFENIFDISNQYFALSTTILLVPGKTQLPYLLTPFLVFEPCTWLASSIVILGLIICSYYETVISRYIHQYNNKPPRSIIKEQSFSKSIFIIIGVYLQQGINFKFYRNFSYIFIGLILISSVILENAYSGNFKSFLTVPRLTEGSDTIEKFIRKEFSWGAPTTLWVDQIENTTDPDLQKLMKKFEVHPVDTLKKLIFSDSYGVIVEKLDCGYFSFYDYVTPEALETRDIMKEELVHQLTYLISVRGWPFIMEFDKVIGYAKESGLYDAWEKSLVNKFSDYKTEDMLLKMAYNKPDPLPPQILSIDHITGALILLGIGETVALFVFICEWKRSNKKY